MEFKDFVLGYKKYVEPFLAILVVIGLIYSGTMLYQNYQAKKNIALECGWADEEARCTCVKNDVIAAEMFKRGESPEIILDVELDK